MAVGQARSMALHGLDGMLVTVECDLGRGLPGVSVVGLGDAAVVQARDRIRAAMLNSTLPWPKSKVVMSLSPADVKKEGSSYDLAMVASILAAQGLSEFALELLSDTVVVGELGLDGTVRAVAGVVPMILSAQRRGMRRIVIPEENLPDAQQLVDVVAGLDILAVGSLKEFHAWLRGSGSIVPVSKPVGALTPDSGHGARDEEVDMADIVGQAEARRALEIAAVGGHAIMLTGPPGSGKSMLAERLPTILPPLSATEQVEAAAIHSIAGGRGDLGPIWAGVRPFVSPHPSVTQAALVGGGPNLQPGAISLAHHGVLFLDEAAETRSGVLDCLRIPMESRRVEIARARRSVSYPAGFQLVMAANPCRCGAEDPSMCTCSSTDRRRYYARVSGPIRDRIDVFAQTRRQRLIGQQFPVSAQATATSGADSEEGRAESSAVVAERVAQARERSHHRWRKLDLGEAVTNATIPGRLLRSECAASFEGMVALQEAYASGALSQRGVDRALRVAWSLADLAGVARPGVGEVLDAAELFSDTEEVPA
ncbi:YifB family Mg chelatase-like AAA ATPase [Corynebacterium sp. HMSC27B11]|uniref:YifB family Mg chelatase-like AAA ATPase n=1 Tax=Corynebacterium sp. HMSC27B11 TaxID=1581065 RepID=UPI0008A31ABB|nr:YifB family Mg chelatase-like AAA ATPase [Corynebacterium sp. HMSC27B11]OFS16374.1 magnesium chelatase [Corynebacterium sp. HMSC27B11]